MSDAVSCFSEGFSCSSAILSAFSERLGVNRETALKLPAVFGAGMGTGETCGAVTGALMVAGAVFGKTKGDDMEADAKAYGFAQEFYREFLSRNSSLKCKELIGYDLGTPEGMTQAMESGVFTNVCPKFVQDAEEILGNLLRAE